MPTTFHQTLDQIRSIAETEPKKKGALFERLMRKFFTEDPVYQGHFANVWLWADWPGRPPGFDRTDTGIDLVAEERNGGYCAIQCKCYAAGTTIGQPHLDSFVAASNRKPFTRRIFVHTGSALGPNAAKTLDGLQPACAVLDFGTLAASPFDWPDLTRDDPEKLTRHPTFRLRPHQQDAFNDVIAGLEAHDSGKLVMACGTGKTFTALRIAERVAGAGGRVLYLVPSISLFAQSMREWASQASLPHRYIGVCSDTRAGKKDEDASLHELEIPVTTAPDKVAAALRSRRKDAMTVVFSTYHSLPVIEQAQRNRAPRFDFVLCDEAHRTTGVKRHDEDTSPFVLVHDRKRIRAKKRLYMTATPRLYTEGAIAKAAEHRVDVFSMDDEAKYGPELHRLPFSRAVLQGLLSDYKVVVLALSEQSVDTALQAHLADRSSELNITDAAKIVGCWQALQDPENARAIRHRKPLKRAIAFTNTISSSKRLVRHWNDVVERAIEQLPKAQQRRALRTETQHVDGQHHALDRKGRIEWLKGEEDNTCRILSNARCLSEGIDVPALDAVLFMNPRSSHVDIVQAVGRVMRKDEGKENGYIVLPVAIPHGMDPAEALNDNKRFAVVWSVLRALRSHDDRFNAEINQIDLNSKPTDRIIFSAGGFGTSDGQGEGTDTIGPGTATLPFSPLDLPPGAIYAKIVEKCGDRKYWESWAKDVADIFGRLVELIGTRLADRRNQILRKRFDDFLDELKASINDSIKRADAVAMIAQHMLTRPVFSALFEHYDFATSNPVAKALDVLRKDLGEFGLENEVRHLEPFYESIRLRAQDLDNPEARQRVLMELYEKFFATALKKDAERLGIVYTPVEVVDFILHSAEHVLRREFGRGLGSKNVRILDPFTGTGIFLARLLQAESLISSRQIKSKFADELWANELVLLAYYIAAIHIEEAYHGRLGPNADYAPFNGIVLTDTFNLHTDRNRPKEWMQANSKRAERQQKHDVQVIVGNPPWSVGQKSAADDNPNVAYPDLEHRVKVTYAKGSSAQQQRSLYDHYKMAIRWASDRIGDHGLIAFVTNGSWIEGNADSGLRACLAKEFSSVYVLNLRGNQRTQGERSRQEGGKVFGQGSRASVAISLFVRNPKAEHHGCQIHYRDVGDQLSRQEKLDFLRDAVSVAGVVDWLRIEPNAQHDWIGQRSEEYQRLYPLGTKGVKKAGRDGNAAFQLFSNGWKTGRDAYVYSFSSDALASKARQAVRAFGKARRELRDAVAERDANVLDSTARRHAKYIHWDGKLKQSLRRQVRVLFSHDHVRTVQYRPFVKQHCYADPFFAQRPALMGEVFPAGRENRAICVTGVGSTKPFSAMIVDVMPDLELISKGQCFPRYRYRSNGERQGNLPGMGDALDRVDNITDSTLKTFRVHYRDPKIAKNAIFDYIYGVLHAPDFRQRFANDLAKELPRIPFADDFHAFAAAGKALARLHLGYETCRRRRLEVASQARDNASRYRLGTRKMRYVDDEKSILAINDATELRGIPSEAHRYEVNGRTPLDWIIDRYHIVQDRQSGIVNDPNAWFAKPEDLLATIERVVHVSVETVGIVEGLPEVGAGGTVKE